MCAVICPIIDASYANQFHVDLQHVTLKTNAIRVIFFALYPVVDPYFCVCHFFLIEISQRRRHFKGKNDGLVNFPIVYHIGVSTSEPKVKVIVPGARLKCGIYSHFLGGKGKQKNRNMTKPTIWPVRPAKTQIRLRILTSLRCALNR